jgi:hypothetical protein
MPEPRYSRAVPTRLTRHAVGSEHGQQRGLGHRGLGPYTGWAAINGVEYPLPATPDIDEALVNCSDA